MSHVVGRDIPHDSAALHVTGESRFIDDIAPLSNELLAGIVPSPVACGRLKRLDLSAAQRVRGVAAVLAHGDVGKHNLFGPVLPDETLLVNEQISYLGHPLAIIAAETQAAITMARAEVIHEIEPLPPVLTIDQAIAIESYLGPARHLERGDIAAGFARSDRQLHGVLELGGQEHFYLESMACIAVPGEGQTMAIYSSTQHPSEVQAMVAELLGVPFSHVVVTCKRMGGGFGGKETQAAQPAMIAALLAARTCRPVRFVYTKDDDMRYTGKRHPFKIVYRASFTNDGLITAVDAQLYSNGGCSTDLSFAVLERAMLHSDNAYFLPNIRLIGRVCRTNLPSNTAFRGFGGPQGIAGIENIMEEVAVALGKDSADIRRLNCYGIDDRNITPYGQLVQNNTLPELFDSIKQESEYTARRAEIAKCNATSELHLRGMAISPVKFGISFTRRTLNQANALVNIYLDGSVMVSTGATEMGQGVNTRIRQIVAQELGVSYENVIVVATSTDKNINTSPTAASSGTDLNGAAAVDACRRLRERLAEVASVMLSKPADGLAADSASVRFKEMEVFDLRAPGRTISFGEVVRRAYELRVSLGERGFYATPGVDFNRETGRGTPFLYFTNGIACSEVTIDRFTGEMKVVRVDLIMDVGKSISPGIDRGQIVGGFVQGMGWVTTEELVYGSAGDLQSYSPTTYKIPAVTDVPEIFNVRFLNNPDNAISLYRSKAVGEPPLILGISVWLAVKNALSYADASVGLASPATGENILMALMAARKAKPAKAGTEPLLSASSASV